MKKSVYKISFLLVGVLLFFSACEQNEIPIFDSQNGRAIAGFNGNDNQSVIFNPAGDTENVITIGVSTVSNMDRAVNVSIDQAATTLDPSAYSIGDLNPVIPAGQYTTTITVTTIASDNIPASGSVLALKLNSVEDAEILSSSVSKLNLGVDVKCPEVDLGSIPGTYKITVDEFGTSVGDDMLEVVAGPGENQFTLVNPFDHPNPDDGGAQDYMVVVDINPETGALSVARQAAWHYSNFAASPDYGTGRVEGNGTALTCIGKLSFSLKNTVDAGSFGTYGLVLQKQ